MDEYPIIFQHPVPAPAKSCKLSDIHM